MRHMGTCGNFWGMLLIWAMRNNRTGAAHAETPSRETPGPAPVPIPALRRAA